MHEYLMQYGWVFVAYVFYIGVLQSLSVIWMTNCYIKPRKKPWLAYTIIVLIFAVHDTIWSLFGYYEGSNKYLLSFEIIIWCVLVYWTVKKWCVGNYYVNIIHLFAVEFVYQVFGMLLAFPIHMLVSGFDFDKASKLVDEPSFFSVIYLTIIYFCIAGLAKCVWDFIYKHRGGNFNVLLLVFCLADIGALLLYSWMIVGISFLVCAYFIVISFRQHNQNEKHLRQQFAFYQELAEKQAKREKEISVIRHDIANHMNVMEEMQKDEEGQELLKKLDKANRSMTGIPVLDCLIREKASLCEKEGISFEREGGAIGETKITEYEFVSLFGNLLDNAIEAAKETEEKTVKLVVEKQQGVLKIKVSNSKLVERKPLENDFKTTKKDKKNHGLGRRIVRDIVEVHGGRVSYHDDREQMRVVVLMQL